MNSASKSISSQQDLVMEYLEVNFEKFKYTFDPIKEWDGLTDLAKERYQPYITEIHNQINLGVAWLDKNIPDWFNKINVDVLSIIDSSQCICGQLFIDSQMKQQIIHYADDGYIPSSNGFDFVEDIFSRSWINQHGFDFENVLIESRREGLPWAPWAIYEYATVVWIEQIEKRRISNSLKF